MESIVELQDITTVLPQKQHTTTVIAIHGAGESIATWKTIIVEALAPKLPNVCWILPQAPNRPISVHQGQLIPCWFDTVSLPPALDEFDEAGVLESVAMINKLVESQIQAGIDSRRIVLMGFSQGSALGLMVALTGHYSLGGVVNLSGWIPIRARHMMHATSSLPVLWCHGNADDVIPISYGESALAFLRESVGILSGMLECHFYDGLGHEIQEKEVVAVASWLQRILAENSSG